MRFSFVIITAAYFFASCGSGLNDKIDLGKALDDSQTDNGASLYGHVEVIELDDSVGMRLGPFPSIETIMNNDIIIRNKNDIYHFSRNGTYLNPIGRYGNGHAEHGQIMSVSCDTTNRKVFVSTLSSEVYVYTFDGNYICKYKLKTADNERIKSTCYSEKHGLMAELRQYNGTEYNVLIASSDPDGDIVDRELIYSDKLDFPVSRESTSEMYPYGHGVKVKLEYSGVLFCVGDDNHTSVELTCRNRIPDRRMVEDASLKHRLWNDYIQVLDLRESDRYLYLVLSNERRMRCAVYDKQSRRFLFSRGNSNPKLGGGMVLQGVNGRFWPTWAGGRLSASVLLPESAGRDGTRDLPHGAAVVIAHE